MVEEYQHEAKKTFAQGKFMYRKSYNQFNMAIRYCEKMEMTAENKHTLATLYGNCALIQLKKENFRTCLKDCNAALALEVRFTTTPLFRYSFSKRNLMDSRTTRRFYIERPRHWRD